MSDKISIGSSMHIKGELTGKEDLTIDGRVDGQIMLTGHQLTIEENGHVTAEINDASTVIVRGTMSGNITASDMVEVASQGSMQGDIRAPRVVLADGSRFKGKIDTAAKSTGQRPAVPPAPPKAAVEV
jgi:cytoskeletal protein CcmA (bactofilin family)